MLVGKGKFFAHPQNHEAQKTALNSAQFFYFLDAFCSLFNLTHSNFHFSMTHMIDLGF
jgi:hypothetical protein